MTQKVLAVPLSFFFPGLGQAMRGDLRRAILMALLYWAAVAGIWGGVLLKLPAGKTTVVVLLLSSWGSRIAMGVDAYRLPGKSPTMPTLILSPILFCLLPWLGSRVFFEQHYTRVRTFTMPSQSMQPAIQPGDTFITDCRPQTHKIGEVVVLKTPQGMTVTKRIAALGGDVFAQKKGRILINGQPLEMPWAREEPQGDIRPILVPPRTVFVVGDDLNNSRDSREFGPIPEEDVLGHPLWILFGSQWSRIGTPIL